MHSALAQRGTRLHNTYAYKMAFNTPLKNTLKKATTNNNNTKAYDVEKRIPERKERNTKEMKGGKEVRNKREGKEKRVKEKKERKKEGRKEIKKERMKKENKRKTNRRKREE